MATMHVYDLCLAWNWEYDAGFISLLEAVCTRRGFKLLQVTPYNLDSIIVSIETSKIGFLAFLDRASDSDPRFQPLVEHARESGVLRINPQEQARWSHDKATMHLEFLTAGLVTPYTIILPPFNEQPNIPPADLSPLAGSFAIKPACGGGGDGVVLEAYTWDQVHTARQQFPDEKYLLQAHVTPLMLEGRPAWFRVLVCAGAVYPCWWDPHSHAYTKVRADERARFGLRNLYEIPRRIDQICGLHLYSTEIAVTGPGHFIIVDYVNDPVDLRLKSEAFDGVPDAIVENIASRLIRMVNKK